MSWPDLGNENDTGFGERLGEAARCLEEASGMHRLRVLSLHAAMIFS